MMSLFISEGRAERGASWLSLVCWCGGGGRFGRGTSG